MPAIRKKQESKPSGVERKRRAPASSSKSGPLAAFFANYSPQFKYDATASASLEFYRLCDKFGWKRDSPQRQDAHQKYKDALVQEFNGAYGTDVNSLANWQKLCRIVRVDPVPDDLHACREAVDRTFVNLVDLVDINNMDLEVQLFESERKLSEYTISTGKFFPRENAHAGGLLQYLLRHIINPRSDVPSHRDRRRGGRGRRP